MSPPPIISTMLSKVPIGNAIPLRAYNRLLRAINPHRVARANFGARLNCDLREFIQSTIYHFGEWEPVITRLFPTLVSPGSVFVDVGANVGYYSLLAEKLDAAQIIAIEPCAPIAEQLRTNLELNGAQKIRVVESAAGDEHGIVTIYCGPSDNMGRTSIREDSGFTAAGLVPLAPLSELLSADEMARTSLIKIDVEGAEVPIVANVLRNLDRYPPDMKLLVEVGDLANSRWPEMFAELLKAGFRAVEIANPYDWRSLSKTPRNSGRVIEQLPSYQADLLFARQ